MVETLKLDWDLGSLYFLFVFFGFALFTCLLLWVLFVSLYDYFVSVS